MRESKSLNGTYNSRKRKPDDKIIRVEGGIPQIVDTDKFMKVKSIFADRKQKSGSFTAKHEYLLSGKITCGECGSSYVGNYQKPSGRFPEYITYRCGRKNKSVSCGNKAVCRNDIESIVLKLLSEKVFSEDMFESIAAHYEEYAAAHNTELNKSYSLSLETLHGLDTQIANIVSVMAKTGSAALAERLAVLESDREKCRQEITETELKLAENGKTDRNVLHSAFKQAKEMLLNGALENRKNIIDNYVDSVIVYSDRIEIIINVSSDYTITETISQ